jgi:carotenoid 1,2-hydratase
VSLNVALYGGTKRWAMTERGRAALQQARTTLAIGPSGLTWDGEALTIDIDEITAPLPRRLRGRLRLLPTLRNDRVFTLDAAGRHRWQPIAPVARVEVELERPDLRWSGTGYFDTNDGDRPLEADFAEWDWCRAPTARGGAILYNAIRSDGSAQSLALRFAAGREVEEVAALPVAPLPPTLWRKARSTRADAETVPAITQRLEDAPFYSRSVIDTQLWGERVTAVHESLSMRRFTAPIVQAMLPFRIPRALW